MGIGYDSAGFLLAPRIRYALMEASLMVMLCPSTIPQLKRFATAPATWAAATEVPVRVVMGTAAVPAEPVPRPAAVPAEPIPRPTAGPEILTPGAAISGLISPPTV